MKRSIRRIRPQGQAAILVLFFLIPMVLAFGMSLRTGTAVLLKMRLQNATDAAALAAGAEVSRVMNQVAIHNLAIVKYHALCAATKTAIKAVDKTITKVTQEQAMASKELACWAKAVAYYTSCCSNIFCPEFSVCPGRLQASQDCQQCLQQQLQQWQRILQFWQAERSWLQSQLSTFQGQIGPLVARMGRKSKSMLDDLDSELSRVLSDVARRHGLDEYGSSGIRYCYISRTGLVTSPGSLDPMLIVRRATLSEFASIAMDAKEPYQSIAPDGLVAGINHFEGPPPKLNSQVSKKDGQTQQQSGTWGATNYILEYIYNVHFGVPGYFKYSTMHGPLGNPDTDAPSCGGDNHPGCERNGGDYSGAASSQGCAQGSDEKPCHRDWKDYSRDYARDQAEQLKKSVNDEEFGSGSEYVYMLAQRPVLEFVVGGKIPANQGFFHRLFPAHTMDQSDDAEGALDSKLSFYALSKFELYNLTESDGKILGRQSYGQYPKSLMTQDWRTLMTPIFPDETAGERSIIQKQMLH
ncbi:MAG: hypothetical protein HY815_08515 [Candidatus Riflebacteria bacterium]|nr:hypothetical protein [Candidatus Riflebacteria bacterium]